MLGTVAATKSRETPSHPPFSSEGDMAPWRWPREQEDTRQAEMWAFLMTDGRGTQLRGPETQTCKIQPGSMDL